MSADKYPILRWFDYEHLPEESPQRDMVESFKEFAYDMANYLPYNAETSTGLRKLLEAKDCFVRSIVSASD